MSSRRALIVVPMAAMLAGLVVAGCSSTVSYAVPTGTLRLPPRSGPVAIYAAAPPPTDAVELGVVEVRASGDEATVEQLFPKFVQRVAELGGNAAVIRAVRGRFDQVARTYIDTFYYPCGVRMMCSSIRAQPAVSEVMVVSMEGRALQLKGPLPSTLEGGAPP